MNLIHLEHGLYWVQSGVLPKKKNWTQIIPISAQLDMCETAEKNNC